MKKRRVFFSSLADSCGSRLLNFFPFFLIPFFRFEHEVSPPDQNPCMFPCTYNFAWSDDNSILFLWFFYQCCWEGATRPLVPIRGCVLWFQFSPGECLYSLFNSIISLPSESNKDITVIMGLLYEGLQPYLTIEAEKNTYNTLYKSSNF